MNLGPDVNLEEIARMTVDFNGAQLKAVCVEAGNTFAYTLTHSLTLSHTLSHTLNTQLSVSVSTLLNSRKQIRKRTICD
jgi:ATP-dependent 26S proteasome regulatory subunit